MIRTILTAASLLSALPALSTQPHIDGPPTVTVASTGQAQDNLPIEKNARTGQFITTLKINGIESRCIIDTGATHTTLDKAFVTRQYPDARLMPVRLQGTTNVQTPPLLMFGSIAIGPLSLGNFPLFVTDLSPVNTMMEKPVAGILGTTTLLQNPAPFIFSAQKAKVWWSKQSPSFPSTMRGRFDDNQRFIATARAGGREFPMLLDTGSTITIVPHGTWEPDPEQTRTINRADINTTSQHKMQRGKPMDLDLGEGLILKNIRPWIAAPGQPGQIGMDILDRFDFCIERKNGNFTMTARMNEQKPAQ